MLEEGITELTNPRTGLSRIQIRNSDERDVEETLIAARTAHTAWAGLVPRERSARLQRLAGLISDHVTEYAEAERVGTGKPLAEALAEVEQSVDVLRFYAGAARAEQAPAGGSWLPGRESWVRWEPLGVVAAIVPWNYPLLMAMWRCAPALAVGNAVVLKPAVTTPDSALLLADHARECLGAGVLTVVPGDRRTGRLLVESPVDMVAFTGSHTAGRDVVARAGLRRVSLELGGNCAAIVLPDAPEYTYESLAAACTYNAGQSCAAPARVITLKENYAETIESLAKAMNARRAGPDFGPLNNAAQTARYDRITEGSLAGIRHVGQISVEAEETAGYWRPSLLLADLPEDAPAITEEVFGPALTVQKVDTVTEAIQLANKVPQTLAASVWGNGAGRLLDVARGLNCGETWINCHLEQTAELPHGGRGESGQGTDLSVLALTEYQRPKTVTVRLTDAGSH